MKALSYAHKAFIISLFKYLTLSVMIEWGNLYLQMMLYCKNLGTYFLAKVADDVALAHL